MSELPMRMLIVEDEEDFRETCARWMQRKGHQVTTAASGAEAFGLCESQSFDVGVFDMNMPGMSGMELLQRVQQAKIEMEVVILTGQGTIESAVAAMKMGACDYLTKPCALGDLLHHCLLARTRGLLRRENQQLKALISRDRPAMELIGDSAPMRDIVRMIKKVAPTDKPVLIEGESGTGKEVVARAIQQNGQLGEKPFVTINCAALPEQLVESELFGHQKGAFTGAVVEKPGLFEIADGGTLFIDEVGELPLSLQPKLLRVLEDGSMRRIGSHKERHVRVRIIAATNRDLACEVKQGNFREDLYYRLNVLSIKLPPLRDRCGDVDRLIEHYLPAGWHLDRAARAAMNRYPWPGNIRQLINAIQRATILADGREVTLDDLPAEVADMGDLGDHDDDHGEHEHDDHAAPLHALPRRRPLLPAAAEAAFIPRSPDNFTLASTASPSIVAEPASDGLTLDSVARAHVLAVLEKLNGNKAKAARVLGIHRRKLYRLLERFEDCHDSKAHPGTRTAHHE